MSENGDRRLDLALAAPKSGRHGCADECCGSAESASRPVVPVEAGRRVVLSRRVRLLVAATITYNIVEAIVAISAGTVASSTALIGFGLDSVIEVASAAAVAWQFAGKDPEAGERTENHRGVVFRAGRVHHG